MMLFFNLFISKVLEITVPVDGRTTMAVRRYEASAVPPTCSGVHALQRTVWLYASLQVLVILKRVGRCQLHWRVRSGWLTREFYNGCLKGLPFAIMCLKIRRRRCKPKEQCDRRII